LNDIPGKTVEMAPENHCVVFAVANMSNALVATLVVAVALVVVPGTAAPARSPCWLTRLSAVCSPCVAVDDTITTLDFVGRLLEVGCLDGMKNLQVKIECKLISCKLVF
jgi:hypothetical protein